MNNAYMVSTYCARDNKRSRVVITAENENEAQRRALDEFSPRGSRVEFCEFLCVTPDEFAKGF